MSCISTFCDLVIEDAPCLERLIVLHPHCQTKLTVMNAPKLTVLGFIYATKSQLFITSKTVEEMNPRGPRCLAFSLSLRTVRVLLLSSIGPDLDAVVGYLRWFPCAEKLYIESAIETSPYREEQIKTCGENLLQYKALNPLQCPYLRLTEICVNDYRGSSLDVNFAKYFIMYARRLKVMRFHMSCGHQWFDYVSAGSYSCLNMVLQKLILKQYRSTLIDSVREVLKMSFMTCRWLIRLLPHFDHVWSSCGLIIRNFVQML